MRGWWAFLLCCALTVSATAARAQPLSEADWRFIKAKAAASGDMTDEPEDDEEPDFEEVLLQSAAASSTATEAIRKFARRLDAAPDAASEYAGLIVASVRHRQECERRCSFGQDSPLYRRAARVALREPTGGLLWTLAQSVRGYGSVANPNGANLVALILRHPAAARIFRRLAAYSEEDLLVAALWATIPSGSAPEAGMIVPRIEDADHSGWIDAVFEAAEERLTREGAAPALRAQIAHINLARMLQLGRTEAAVTRYEGYPPEVRQLVPVLPGNAGVDTRYCDRLSAAMALADNLAAALWLQGKREEARIVIRRSEPGRSEPHSDYATRRSALMEAIAPTRQNEELFEQLFARASNDNRLAPGTRCVFDRMNWLRAVGSAGPALRELVAQRYSAARYHDVAALFRSPRGGRDLDEDRAADLGTVATLLAADAQARQAGIAASIAAANPEPAPTAEGLDARAPRVHLTNLQPWWTEQAGAPERAGATEEEQEGVELPAGVELPVSSNSVLRFDERGGEKALIYSSTEYDLPGEVPAAGLWFVRTVRGQWTEPLYLGLQQYFPYSVRPRSSIPLIHGDRLRIDAVRSEIAGDSISFPPVGLRLRGKPRNVILEIDLARIRSDTDHDGLTDIEERRLGLDGSDPDTDGDGLLDGADPLPLTPRMASPDPVRTAMARAILDKIFRFDDGAITLQPDVAGDPLDLARARGSGSSPPSPRRKTLFLVGDDDLFAGVTDQNIRLLLYSPADVAALRQGSAPFYPPRISTQLSSLDGLTHFFSWSADWVGGSFLVRCSRGGECRVEELTEWIT